MRQFELVIFDCDGVLVDSEPITSRVFSAMLNDLGLSLTPADLFEQFIGRSLAQCLDYITGLLGRPLPADFVPELRRRAAAALQAEVTAVLGITQALNALTIPYCVASSGEPEKVRLTLGQTGLLPRFEQQIFSATDVANPKPAPDLFLLAARRNGVEPGACAVVEDSPVGVQAGVAAGMYVFGFAAHTPAARLREAGAHAIFTNMACLPYLLTIEKVRDATLPW
jgi:HAD superfamily hydrolase (TIGR01509 family)